MLTKTVEAILRDNEAARSSDKHLFLAYLNSQGIYLSPEQRDRFMRISSLESVRRVRQKLQEQGKYPAREDVKKHRQHKAMVIEQNAPIAKPERLERLFDDRQYRSF